ncbi:MAG: hypothetical protein P8Y65_05585 [Campylobacterales bacterium]
MKKMLAKGALSCFVLMASSAVAEEQANANILVSNDNTLYEYTSSGELLSQMPIPQNSSGGSAENARDLIALEDGRIAVYNGTFSPELSVYDGTQWHHFTLEGWSTANIVSYGGIAAVGNKIYLTDSSTANGGEAKGLVEIDLDNGTTARYFPENEYIDVTLGADGLLYALRNVYGNLDVIDPATLGIVRSVDLGHTSESRAVTANARGDIFMASWNGDVTRYDSTGVVMATLYIDANLGDIELDKTGQLIVSNWSGSVYVTDEALLSYRAIRSDSSYHFSFAASRAPVTVPTQLFRRIGLGTECRSRSAYGVRLGALFAVLIGRNSFCLPADAVLAVGFTGV